MPYECQDCGILQASGMLCERCAARRKRQLPSGSAAQSYRPSFDPRQSNRDPPKPPPSPPTIEHEPIRRDTTRGDGRAGQHIDMDRADASRALSKVFAYMAVGKRDMAREWARKLISWLESV